MLTFLETIITGISAGQCLIALSNFLMMRPRREQAEQERKIKAINEYVSQLEEKGERGPFDFIKLSKRYDAQVPKSPLVSVIIPARNEASRIGDLVCALLDQNYHGIEVIVYDDQSEDGTADAVRKAVKNNPRVTVIEGKTLPQGWTGKNWACYNAAKAATGNWLLFLDADVRVEPGFVRLMLGEAIEADADLCTAFPQFIPGRGNEALLLSMIPYSIFGMLPFYYTENSSNPGFGMANGQMLMARTAFYHEFNLHELVKERILEDVAIGRLVKKVKGRVRIVRANGQASVKMYDQISDAINGLSKNAHQITGSAIGALLAAAFLGIMALLPLWGMLQFNPMGFIAYGAGVILKLITDRMAGLPLWLAPLYPISFLIAVYVMLRSLYWHRNGKITWKGREYGKT